MINFVDVMNLLVFSCYTINFVYDMNLFGVFLLRLIDVLKYGTLVQ